MCLVPLLGYRPPTRVLQLSLSWAFLSSCLQVSPNLLMSASKSRLQQFLGLPLFLFPWGFQDRACFEMLVEGFRRVWPIHLQRLIMILASAGLWLVLCHRSSLLMVIGQRIRRILRRHELMKVCTFVVAIVVLHVSEPYSRTGLTLLLKILILV